MMMNEQERALRLADATLESLGEDSDHDLACVARQLKFRSREVEALRGIAEGLLEIAIGFVAASPPELPNVVRSKAVLARLKLTLAKRQAADA